MLGSLGYEGDLDALMPWRRRNVMFGSGEFVPPHIERPPRRAIAHDEPGCGGKAIVVVDRRDAADRLLLANVVSRAGKAMCLMRSKGAVKRALGMRETVVWQIAPT